ncbi:hypothetical protein FQA39_LY12401 [Lamprigera yunnana]|nr:hypothetical protein FQA39_LY12401 [Lamprigera yunnana]
MSSEAAPEDRSSDTEQEVKSKSFIREVRSNSKGKICPKLKLRDSRGQDLSLIITDSEIENTKRTEVRNTQNKFIEPRRKKMNATRRSTAGTASTPGPKGTEIEEKRANKEPPGKEEAPTRETGSDEIHEHLAEITRNVMREGAKWLPLSATTPSDEGYPEDVDRLAFYRRYVYIMSIVPENSVRISVEARKGLRIAVDQMKDRKYNRYIILLNEVSLERKNVQLFKRIKINARCELVTLHDTRSNGSSVRPIHDAVCPDRCYKSVIANFFLHVQVAQRPRYAKGDCAEESTSDVYHLLRFNVTSESNM